MNTKRYFTIGGVIFALLLSIVTGPAIAADDETVDPAVEREQKLIDVLTSADSPKSEKAITCKYLAVYGSEKAVPVIAPLLEDAELCSWARIALEAIEGEASSQALRDALTKVKGRQLIGVVNSLGVRGDVAAIDAIAALIKNSDAGVAEAAAVALGKIGGEKACGILESSLASATDPSAVAEGCILCAEQQLKAGNKTGAAAIYEKVRKANISKQRTREATRGVILAKGKAGIPLLVELLKSDDRVIFATGLTTARELSGPEVTSALVDALSSVSPERQPLVLSTLAASGNASALPIMIKAAAEGPTQTRVMAIEMLGRNGNASCLPTLIAAGLDEEQAIAVAAKAAIESLPGGDVNAAITKQLASAEGATRQLLIAMVGARRIESAAAALIKAAGDEDAATRSTAILALGQTISQKDISVLITAAIAPANAEDMAPARKALKAACIRMPDGEACAATLTAAMSRASLDGKVAILEVLGAMGNKTALKTLGQAGKDRTPELQDVATRVLGEWMTIEAAPVLLDLAKTAPENSYRIRAMRGYIRLLRQFVIPDPQRAEMCRLALETATRPDERKLVYEVMERYPSLDMLRLAVGMSKVPQLKADATAISLVIAQKVAGNKADVQKLMDMMGHKTVKVEIVKALYGSGTTFTDVTDILRKKAGSFPLITLSSDQYNKEFGGDPTPGSYKVLKIQYKLDGKAGEVTLPENATILLPAP